MPNDSQPVSKQYTLKIKGHQFTVSSTYSEDEIRAVESFLLKKIDEVAASSDTFNLLNLVILVALNLADEVLNVKKDDFYYSNTVKECLQSFCDQLDRSLLTNKAN